MLRPEPPPPPCRCICIIIVFLLIIIFVIITILMIMTVSQSDWTKSQPPQCEFPTVPFTVAIPGAFVIHLTTKLHTCSDFSRRLDTFFHAAPVQAINGCQALFRRQWLLDY